MYENMYLRKIPQVDTVKQQIIGIFIFDIFETSVAIGKDFFTCAAQQDWV